MGPRSIIRCWQFLTLPWIFFLIADRWKLPVPLIYLRRSFCILDANHCMGGTAFEVWNGQTCSYLYSFILHITVNTYFMVDCTSSKRPQDEFPLISLHEPRWPAMFIKCHDWWAYRVLLYAEHHVNANLFETPANFAAPMGFFYFFFFLANQQHPSQSGTHKKRSINWNSYSLSPLSHPPSQTSLKFINIPSSCLGKYSLSTPWSFFLFCEFQPRPVHYWLGDLLFRFNFKTTTTKPGGETWDDNFWLLWNSPAKLLIMLWNNFVAAVPSSFNSYFQDMIARRTLPVLSVPC